MNWLNYHHLRYFWVAANAGSLQAAAEQLRVSPPSISVQIAALEEALGQPLFRRSGRRKVLTETGQLVLRYADEIFTLGNELLTSVRGHPAGQKHRLNIGIVDSLPKLVTQQILRPAFDSPNPVHVVCREGKLEDLVGQLIAHRLDLVLTDEPVGGALKVRTFNHHLGRSSVSICAATALARSLRRGFPHSLHEAPALMPSRSSSLRRGLEQWLQSIKVVPQILAEFEDLALMKTLAADGRGWIALPTVAMEDARQRYGFHHLGKAGNAKEEFLAITAERRVSDPLVQALVRQSL
jgi:LysR family transcriptional activator of nhaA